MLFLKLFNPMYRLLIVDDEEFFANNLKSLLIESGEYFVKVLNNGINVLDEVTKNKYDAVLLDISLPDIRGDLIAKIISAMKIDCKIILMSAYTDIIKSLENNSVQFQILEKPFQLSTLIKSLN